MDLYVPITLPSHGKTYSGVKIENIKIRPLLGSDEEQIALLSSKNAKRKILEILSNLVQGVDPKILTTGDVQYILLWEVINSYSNMYPLTSITCPNCFKKDLSIKVNLNKINSVDLPENFKQPVEVTLSTGKIKLRLRTIEDEVMALEHESLLGSTHLYDLAILIDDDKNVFDWIKDLKIAPAKDLKVIRDFEDKYRHGPDMEAKFVCPNCKTEVDVIVPFRLDRFLYPDS